MGFQEIIKEEDLLNLLGISKKTLAYLRNKRGLPFIELTRYERTYYEDDVVEWLQKNSRKRGSGDFS